jgi:hypothetical protein
MSLRSRHEAREGTRTAEGIDPNREDQPSVPGLRVKPLLAYLFLFPLIYAPAITVPYAFGDDYPNLGYTMLGTNGGAIRQQAEWGRPVIAVLLHTAFSLMSDIGDLRYMRFVGVIGIGLLAWLLHRALVSAGVNSLMAFSFPVLICVMPPFQVFAAWTTTSFNVYSAISAGLALTAASAVLSRSSRVVELKGWLLATILLTLALTIYQPGAMLFWTFAAIGLFAEKNTLSGIAKKFFALLIFSAIPLGIEFLLTRLMPIALEGSGNTQARAQLVLDIPRKTHWFFTEALPNALNLAHVGGSGSIATGMALFILVGFLLYVSGSAMTRFGKLGIALLLVPLSYLPNLLVSEDWASHRSLVGLTTLVALYLGFAVCGYARLRKAGGEKMAAAVISCLALGCAFLASRNISLEFAVPQMLEYQVLRSELNAGGLERALKIYFVQPCWCDSVAPLVRYDEFGLPSSAQPWVPVPMTFLALRDKGIQLPVIVAPLNGPVDPPPDSLVVDLRKMKGYR